VIDAGSSLIDVCFAVSAALEAAGMSAVLTGGSAAVAYAPLQYASLDADFILDRDDSLDDVAVALAAIGFARYGKSRIFTHPNTEFTIDFPKGPLAVGGEYVRETAVLSRGDHRLRVLTLFDCIRDRLAHYYYWDDYTALNAAVSVAATAHDPQLLARLRTWTQRESPDLLLKLAEFQRRLSATM
jgi:hypothetical protein